ncbi:hypothetical protein CUJ83_09025 [Methanocella sp. CWC-04]|uniref:Uncharacterized protein n=2 Tax=Methanooceanicella nereidis TaxID=2052831 RepID=A0AAP2W7F1_9EURY|nr:hypothetical protein [Methanocella sp. CWC-04]
MPHGAFLLDLTIDELHICYRNYGTQHLAEVFSGTGKHKFRKQRLDDDNNKRKKDFPEVY